MAHMSIDWTTNAPFLCVLSKQIRYDAGKYNSVLLLHNIRILINFNKYLRKLIFRKEEVVLLVFKFIKTLFLEYKEHSEKFRKIRLSIIWLDNMNCAVTQL